MRPDELKAIKERANNFDDRLMPGCPHGREPVDRCDVCTGDDARLLVAEIERLWTVIGIMQTHSYPEDEQIVRDVLREIGNL